MSDVPAIAPKLTEKTQEFARAALSNNTLRCYEGRWRHFAGYCADLGVSSLPAAPEVLSNYLSECGEVGKAASTINQTVCAIKWMHECNDLEDPTKDRTFRLVHAGIRRKVGTAQKQQAALTVERLIEILGHLPISVKGVRDKAILLFGFASAMRGNELVALDVEDLERTFEGMLVNIRKSKTDPYGKGVTIAVPFGSKGDTCPVIALTNWLEIAGITSGPIFRSVAHRGVYEHRLSVFGLRNVVKSYGRLLDSPDADDITSHSLRAGYVTSAAERGVSALSIMQHTRHKSTEMINLYIRKADAFKNHPSLEIL